MPDRTAGPGDPRKGRGASSGERHPPSVALRTPVVVGLLVMAAVHLHLYAVESYARIPTIGWLFLVTVVASVVLAVDLALWPHPLAALAAAGMAVGVLAGYLLSLLLPLGLFMFKEPGISYSGAASIAAETVVAVVGLRIATGVRRRHRPGAATVHPRGV